MKSGLEHQRLEIGLSREIEESLDGLVRSQFDFTTQTPPDSGDILTNQGLNYLDNSDMDFSTDAYTNSVPAGGDIADECYNFFRQRFIRITDAVLVGTSPTLLSASGAFKSAYTYPMPFFALAAGTGEKALVGTITRVDDNTATMSVNSQADITNGIVFFGEAYAETGANALKASGHSLFAAETANDSIARWDEAAGQCEMGGDGADNFDLAIPLPFNLATRGLNLFFSANVKLRTGETAPNPVVLYVGVYDTTSGNTMFLEADNFALTVNYIGTAGAKEYEMIVIGTFSNGEQVASDVVTVSGVAAVLDADNYLDWNWVNAPRILDFALYRRDTGTGDVVRVFTIYNGETRFFDKNTPGENTVVSFPSAAARREYAYAESQPFLLTAEYKRVPVFFRIPPTYLQSATTGRQILRIGIYNDPANDVRCAIFDRPMLSLTESIWSRSSRDFERIQSTTPTSTIPDGNQGGGVYCFTGNNPVIVKDRPSDEWRSIPISEAKKGMFIHNGRQGDRIVEVRENMASEVFEVELANNIYLECTASERFITNPSDRQGTRLDKLGVGDFIQTHIGGVNYQTRIVRITPKRKAQKVFTLSLEKDKIFLVGRYAPRWWRNPIMWLKRPLAGAKAHNRKQFDYEVF